MITVDVIIPSFTNDHIKPILKTCISTLRDSEKYVTFNVIVIESNYEAMFEQYGQDITIAYDQEKFNYNHALNLGLKCCKNNFVVLANNDLLFYSHWMTNILTAAFLRPEISSFSPWNSMWSWHDRCFPMNRESFIVGYDIGRHIAGWCIVAKREIFDKIKLSETVDFWYSDNVYADELKRNQIIHALIATSRVDHLTSQTKQLNQDEQIAAYRQYNEQLSCEAM